VDASAELMRAVGYIVEVINSGCCGMAGAFGYESEHYDVSMQVGELVLLPEARKTNANGGQVAAVGTSCRSQIADGAGVEARHPVVLVAQKLKASKRI
jgi:Fe-S oxidoreductase